MKAANNKPFAVFILRKLSDKKQCAGIFLYVKAVLRPPAHTARAANALRAKDLAVKRSGPTACPRAFFSFYAATASPSRYFFLRVTFCNGRL